jgi:hypothetical protein
MPQSDNFTRLPDPLVEQNPFRSPANGPGFGAPPPFSDVRPRLPQPILPQHPDWLEFYWRAWEMIWSHLTQPSLKSKLHTPHIATPPSQPPLYVGYGLHEPVWSLQSAPL